MCESGRRNKLSLVERREGSDEKWKPRHKTRLIQRDDAEHVLADGFVAKQVPSTLFIYRDYILCCYPTTVNQPPLFRDFSIKRLFLIDQICVNRWSTCQ